MNRDKYVNDESYREGYEEGRKEGANALISVIKPHLDKIKEEIEYIEHVNSEGTYQQGYSESIHDKKLKIDTLDLIREAIDSETRIRLKECINADYVIDAVLDTISLIKMGVY